MSLNNRPTGWLIAYWGYSHNTQSNHQIQRSTIFRKSFQTNREQLFEYWHNRIVHIKIRSQKWANWFSLSVAYWQPNVSVVMAIIFSVNLTECYSTFQTSLLFNFFHNFLFLFHWSSFCYKNSVNNNYDYVWLYTFGMCKITIANSTAATAAAMAAAVPTKEQSQQWRLLSKWNI